MFSSGYKSSKKKEGSPLTNMIFYVMLVLLLVGGLINTKVADMGFKYNSMVEEAGKVTLTKSLLKTDFNTYLFYMDGNLLYKKILVLSFLCAYIVSKLITKKYKDFSDIGFSKNESKKKAFICAIPIAVVLYAIVIFLINSTAFNEFGSFNVFSKTGVKFAVINEDDYKMLTDLQDDNDYTYSVTLSNGKDYDVRNRLFKRVTAPGKYYFAYTDDGKVFGIYPASEFDYYQDFDYID